MWFFCSELSDGFIYYQRTSTRTILLKLVVAHLRRKICPLWDGIAAPTFLFKERQQAGGRGVGQAEYERGSKGDYDQRSRGQGDRGAEADGCREVIGLGGSVEVHGLDDAAIVDHGNDAVEQADDDESDEPAAEQ